jgi:hypothetical protein
MWEECAYIKFYESTGELMHQSWKWSMGWRLGMSLWISSRGNVSWFMCMRRTSTSDTLVISTVVACLSKWNRKYLRCAFFDCILHGSDKIDNGWCIHSVGGNAEEGLRMVLQNLWQTLWIWASKEFLPSHSNLYFN